MQTIQIFHAENAQNDIIWIINTKYVENVQLAASNAKITMSV